MVENKKHERAAKIIVYMLLTIIALIYIIPFVVIISASLSRENDLIKYGYELIPRNFSLNAYEMIMKNPQQLGKAYAVTIFVTAVGTLSAITMTSLTAYPLSRKDFKWRNIISFYIYFTMLFSGGAIPSYILISQYLHLKNKIIVLILPLMMNAWNVMMLRTYFSKIPPSLIEAAKIDGANEFTVFFKIILPMSKTGIATITLMICLAYWNDWYNCMMYMTNEKIISLQYFLHRTMSNIDAILRNAESGNMVNVDISTLPSETARMAMCILAAGPMVFISMFFQKYFVGGLSVGAVKG